jgi:hypothetical protein
MWLVASIETGIPWADKDTEITFKGQKVLLRTATNERLPAICIEYDPNSITFDAMHKLARELMSELCWVFHYSLVELWVCGGSIPINTGPGPKFLSKALGFRVDYLPEVQDPRAKLALAFFREGLSLNSVPYRFLGYWKIVSLLHNDGSTQQIAWLLATLGKLTEFNAVQRLNDLKATGATLEQIVSNHLYGSRRCAVSHATGQTINPDDPNQEADVAKDLPLIKAIGEYAIEHDFGIKSGLTVWKQHLYELAGFKQILGNHVVETLQSGGTVLPTLVPSIPILDLRIEGKPQLATFQRWQVAVEQVKDGVVHLLCRSGDQRVLTRMRLNFKDERLEFEPWNDMVMNDDGSVVAAWSRAEWVEFGRDLLLNGHLQIFESSSGNLLGRKDAFLPVNVNLGAMADDWKLQIEALRAEAARRSTTPPGTGSTASQVAP